jgi:autotransporter-associated beta strand protein
MSCRKSAAAVVSAILATAVKPVLSQQLVVTQIAAMSAQPVNYQYVNYAAIAQGYDATVFDPNAQSTDQYRTFWFQNDPQNGISSGIGMPSYIGQTPASEGNGEAITQIGAVLGASLVGIDKHVQTLDNGNTYDFVQMASRFYDSGTGANLVLNNIGSQGTGSFWYDQLPQILFDGLINQYYSSYAVGSAGQVRLNTIMNNSAAKMHNVIDVLAGNSTTATPSFNYQGFNYVSMTPITGGHVEPDGAGGAAYEQYIAYQFTGNSTYLSDAERAMNALQNTPASQNPLYEVILPFGALTAARLNAEQGTNYDVNKIVNWCFNANTVDRPTWGAISAASWGGYGVSGLIGSTTDQGGYGFAMNSYLYPMAMVPLVRYDDRFANAIGKWMTDLSNSSRLFLKSGLPASNQTNPNWNDPASNYYSYEGLKASSGGVTPQAGGDGSTYNSSWLNWAYGSGDVGVLGSIISRTNVSQILQLNLLATDFFHGPADPSYLLYNPYSTQKTVQINVGASPVNVYDAITDQFLSTNVTGTTTITIPAQTARSIVYTPVGMPLIDNGQNVTVNGIVVNYRSPELNRLYWDLNGSAAGAGGANLSGTWDSSTANWNPNSAGTSNTGAWNSGEVAMFAAGADGTGTYTLTVSGTQNIGGLYFKTGSVTLTGGALNLTSDSYITVAAGNQIINTPIAGSFALLKDGAGTVTLGASNTYTGITSIEAGVVQLANAVALQNTSVDVNVDNGLNVNGLNATLGGLSGSGAVNFGTQTLTVGNNNQNAEYAGVLSGTGTVIKNGSGIWTLDAANTWSGSTILRGGELSVSADSSLGNSANPLTFDGGTLQVTGTTYNSTGRTLTETANGAGFDIVDPNNTFSLPQNITGGFLLKKGAGTLVLSGTNTQNGLYLSAGTVSASSSANLGTGPITFVGSSALNITGSSPVNISNSVSVNSASTLNVANSAGVTLSGSLTLNTTLTKTGEGTLTLVGPATGNQSIDLRNGAIVAATNSPWSPTDNPPGVAVGDASSPSTENLAVFLNSGVTISSGRIFFEPYALQGTKTLGGTFTSGSATYNMYVHLLSSAINLQITDAPGGTFNLPLGILGSTTAGITIVGGGTVVLGGLGAAQSEYFQGITTVENGTLLITGNDIVGNARDTYVLGNSSYSQAVQIGDPNTPATAPLTFLTDAASAINHNISVNNYGGAISLGGATANISTFNSAISLAKSVSLNSVSGGVVNFTGPITGAGGINVAGAGLVNLSGMNTYGGTTNVSAGSSLTISSAGALPSGNTIVNNGSLTINGNSVAGNITGNGILSIGATGAITLTLAQNSGTSSQSGLSILNGSTLDISNNHLFITYGSGPDPISSIAALIASGYAGGAWTGTGITSSAAAAASARYGLGYADSADAGNPAGLPSGTIEIKYTLLGDADLNGIVNGIDFGILAANFNKAVTGWDTGDFDYNNIVNGIDFSYLAANFNKAAANASDIAAINAFAAANGLLSDLPEPTAMPILALGMTALLRRRRKSAHQTT